MHAQSCSICFAALLSDAQNGKWDLTNSSARQSAICLRCVVYTYALCARTRAHTVKSETHRPLVAYHLLAGPPALLSNLHSSSPLVGYCAGGVINICGSLSEMANVWREIIQNCAVGLGRKYTQKNTNNLHVHRPIGD